MERLEQQAIVKFLGAGNTRVTLDSSTFDTVESGGCHWAVCYPAGKRPTGVKNDALVFMGRFTEDPNDIRVFGRAIAISHQPGRDEATREDIERRSWKKRWPNYIRVHHAKFVAGTLSNAVSLNELMAELQAESFKSTKRNAAQGEGNTDPRRAYMQQPAVELSSAGLAWLTQRLDAAFAAHGEIPESRLDELDWPDRP